MYAVYFTVFLPDDFIGKKWAGNFHWCKLEKDYVHMIIIADYDLAFFFCI